MFKIFNFTLSGFWPDGALDPRSNSADYYQFSNVILRRELNYKDSKSYVFNQTSSAEETSFLFQLVYLKLQDIYSLQIPVLLKLQTLLYQKVSSFASQYIFINETITSRNPCKSLYIA